MIPANITLEQPGKLDSANIRYSIVSSIEEGRRMFRKVMETGVRYGRALEAQRIHSNVWNQDVYGSDASNDGIVETTPVVGQRWHRRV